MRIRLTTASVLLCAAVAAEDLIILDNGQRIVGSVIAETQADDHLVTIHTGNGLLRFDHKRIRKMELSYATRRAQVKDDDARGLLELARWCRSQGMKVEALELLDKAIALPNCDPAARVLYLNLFDEVRGPEAALPLYKAWREAGGTDATTLARLAQLEKVKADYEAQYGVGAAEVAAAPPRVDFSREGLEARAWMPESPQYFNPVDLQRVSIDSKDGPTAALKITCKTGNQDKAAVRLGMATSGVQQSLFTFTAANLGKSPVQVGIAIKTGSRYVYHECQPVVLEGGNKPRPLSFNLKTAAWKSEANNWQFSGKIADIDQIREIQILFHNGRQEVTVVVDKIAFQGIKDL